MASAEIRLRTDRGEERLDLDEFEIRVRRGEIGPQSQVLLPVVTGDAWVPAGSLEFFRQLYSPRRLHFARAFSLGGFPKVTVGFIAVCVAWYLAMGLWPRASPDDTLLAYGAKAGPLMLDLGQYWRLVTANLVHKDAIHIAVNLFVLFNFGGALENAFRPLDTLMVFLASALGTTLASFTFGDPISAGASGVAYGALGGAVVFGMKYRDLLPARYRRLLGGAVVPTVLVFLFIGWTSNGVDNWGHLGGLLSGGLAVSLLRPRLLSDPPTPRAIWWGRIVPLTAVAAVLALLGPLTRGHLPRMNSVIDDQLGLSLPVPSEWERGADRLGQTAFYNGLSGYGHAHLSLAGQLSPVELDLAQVAAAFVQEELRVPAAAGRLELLSVEAPVPVTAAGLPGLEVRARYRRLGIESPVDFDLSALILKRGRLSYELEMVWPQELPGYQDVFRRVREGLRTAEPGFLRVARSRVLFEPDQEDARRVLREALLAVGALPASP